MKKGIAGAISVLLSIIMISVSLNLFAVVMMDKKALEYDDGRVYIRLYYEGNPLSLPDERSSLEELDKLRRALENISDSEYMVVNMQPLNWPEAYNTNKAFINYNSRIMEIKPEYCAATQISENVQEMYDFRTTTGRLFESSDFKWSRGAIPVLLGSRYNDTHQIGDVFGAGYLYSDYEFEVVGILESGSIISMSFGNAPLDEMIIMPSIEYDVVPSNEKEYVTQKINGSIQISGVLVTDKKGAPEVMRSLDELLARTGVGKMSYYTSLSEYNFKRNGFISPGLGMFITGVLGILMNVLGITQLLKSTLSLKRKLYLMLAVLLFSVGTYVVGYYVSLETLGMFNYISAGAFVAITIDFALICTTKNEKNN